MNHPIPLRPAIFSALLASTLLAACSNDSPPAAPARGPMPVTVLEMQAQSVPSSIEIMAQTEGARETEVRARVGGILLQRLYQEGQTVKAGQPLFQIDRAPYEIALAEARARAEQAEREMKRLQPLAAAKAVSQKEFDDASSTHALAQANLRQAQLNLSWTTVSAPVAGTTGRAIRSEGNLIGTANDNSLLTSIYQTNPMWVSFSLGESDLSKLAGGKLRAGDIHGVQLILPNGETYAHTGKINFIASNLDTTLGTQALRAEFANPDQQLLPGQFVRVRLLTGKLDGIFLVPQTAVIQSEQGALLMTAAGDNTVAPRPVKLGDWHGKDWIVLGGLQAGDKVIIDNLIKLRPGMPVAPQAPGAGPAGTPGQPAAAPARQG